jgi:hypothetical protein
MRRAGALVALHAALLAFPAGALAGGAGHNPQTKKLEAAFTVALSQRINSGDGCYPAPPGLAAAVRSGASLRTGVAARLKAVRRRGIVYVVRKGTSCNGVRFALRYKRVVYVLDSLRGEVRVIGRKRSRRDPAIAGNRGPLRRLRIATRTFALTTPDRRERLDVRCPRKTFPLGGGSVSSPGLGADGEGFYPHSFERLGAQRGWHITGWVFDPGGGTPASRNVTVQAVCGRGLVPTSSPHRTTFVRPGVARTVVARCPRGKYLMSGGFQRTDFLSDGGNYVTESRAIGPKAWRVSGNAHGYYGGELTAIAYCVESKRPLLSEVSASTPLPFGASAGVTTPPCPRGRRLTSGGFSANGSQQTFFAGGSINANGSWSVSGHGIFGSAPGLTAYGYCLRAKG